VPCSKAPFSKNSDDDDDDAAASTSSDDSWQPAATATPVAEPSSPTRTIAWDDDDDCSTPTSFDEDDEDDDDWMVRRPGDREAARIIAAFGSEHCRPPNDIMNHLLQTLYEDQMLEAGWRVSFVDRHLPAERRTYNYAPSADDGEFQGAKRLFKKLASAMKLLATAGGRLKPATQRMVLTRIRRIRLQLQTLRRCDPLQRGQGRVMAASPELSEYVQDLVERRGFGCVGGDEDEDDDDDLLVDDLMEKRGGKKNRGNVRTACWYDSDMQYVNGHSKIYKHQPNAMGICPPNNVQTGLLARWTIAKASEPSFDHERVTGGAPRRSATEHKPSWDARFPFSQRAPNAARLPPLLSDSSRWQTNLFTG
jgi:hypothetical protein